MKKILILLFVAGLGFAACKKDANTSGEIYGKWRLIATLQDPGDGSGKYEVVTGKPKVLVLSRSGQISGDALPNLHSFEVLDSTRLAVYSEANQNPITYRYQLKSNSLTLNPPCIEGCGFKFLRD